jgi:hypothetical protein
LIEFFDSINNSDEGFRPKVTRAGLKISLTPVRAWFSGSHLKSKGNIIQSLVLSGASITACNRRGETPRGEEISQVDLTAVLFTIFLNLGNDKERYSSLLIILSPYRFDRVHSDQG